MKGAGSFAKGFMSGYKDQRDYAEEKKARKSKDEYLKALAAQQKAQAELQQFKMDQEKAKAVAESEASILVQELNPDTFKPDKVPVESNMMTDPEGGAQLGYEEKYTPKHLGTLQAVLDAKNKRELQQSNMTIAQQKSANEKARIALDKRRADLDQKRYERDVQQSEAYAQTMRNYTQLRYPGAYEALKDSKGFFDMSPKQTEAFFNDIKAVADQKLDDADKYDDRIRELMHMKEAINQKYMTAITKMGVTEKQKEILESKNRRSMIHINEAIKRYQDNYAEAMAGYRAETEVPRQNNMVTEPVDNNPVNRQEVLANFPVSEEQSQLPNSGFGIGPNPRASGNMGPTPPVLSGKTPQQKRGGSPFTADF